MLAFGDSGGKQATVNITFVPAPTPSSGSSQAAATTSSSGTPTAAATTPSSAATAATTLAFTGAGPGTWFILLGGLLLLDLGYLIMTMFYRPREFFIRAGHGVKQMFGGK